MKIYLDTNIYCRPLDDCTQSRIALEAEACLIILQLIESNKLKTLGSDILLYELLQTDKIKQSYVMQFAKFWQSQVHFSNKIVRDAEIIQNKLKLKSRDALHFVSAISDGSQYILTCDDEFIAKTKKFGKIKVVNPIDFVKEIL